MYSFYQKLIKQNILQYYKKACGKKAFRNKASRKNALLQKGVIFENGKAHPKEYYYKKARH